MPAMEKEGSKTNLLVIREVLDVAINSNNINVSCYSESDDTNLLTDTGWTEHVTHNHHHFIKYTELGEAEWANGQKEIPILGVGMIVLCHLRACLDVIYTVGNLS